MKNDLGCPRPRPSGRAVARAALDVPGPRLPRRGMDHRANWLMFFFLGGRGPAGGRGDLPPPFRPEGAEEAGATQADSAVAQFNGGSSWAKESAVSGFSTSFPTAKRWQQGFRHCHSPRRPILQPSSAPFGVPLPLGRRENGSAQNLVLLQKIEQPGRGVRASANLPEMGLSNS